jgi:hypothetical protein
MPGFVGGNISAMNERRLGESDRRPLAIMLQENGALIGGLSRSEARTGNFVSRRP